MEILGSTSSIGFGDSFLVLLIGMLVIFFVLTILIFAVIGYVKAFNVLDKKLKDKKAISDISIVTPKENNQQESYDEIVAVISATIARIYESESGSDDVVPFRVRSIMEIK